MAVLVWSGGLSLDRLRAQSLDVDALTEDLASENYSQRNQARQSLLRAFAEASVSGRASFQHAKIQETIIQNLDVGLPLTEQLYLIRLLELFGSEEAVNGLEAYLDSTDENVRDSVRRALAALPGSDATNLLLKELDSQEVEKQLAVVDLLQHRDAPVVVTSLITMLSDRNEVLRTAAAKALGQLHDKKAVPALLKAHANASGNERLACAVALLQHDLNTDELKKLLEGGENIGIKSGAFSKIIASDENSAMAYLVSLLDEDESVHRSRFLRLFMSEASASAKDKIVARLAGMNPADQLVIISAIGEFELSIYEDDLLGLLDKTQDEVKAKVIIALSRIGGDKSFQVIYEEFLNHSSSKALASALSVLKSNSADMNMLKIAKNGPRPSERILAIKVLELRNTPGATELLNDLISNSPDEQLLEASVKSLENIGNLDSITIMANLISNGNEHTKIVQRSLKRLIANYNAPEVIWETAYQPALKQAQSAQSEQALVAILDAMICDSSVAYLRGHLLDLNSEMRPHVVRLLQRMRDTVATELWIELMKENKLQDDERDTVLKACVDTLTKGRKNTESKRLALLAPILKSAPDSEFRKSVFDAIQTSNDKVKNSLKPSLKKLENDSEIGEEVKAFMSTL